MKNTRNHKMAARCLWLLLSLVCLLQTPVAAYWARENDGSAVEIYRHKENTQKKIALTFDDGPHPRYTPEILEILDTYGIKATFFVVGENAEHYPDTLEEVIRRGHEVGNHTYTHPHLICENYTGLVEEIGRCESTIYRFGECRTKYFRPPEGLVDTDVRVAASKLGYSVILWNIDTRDWAHTPPAKIAANVLSHVHSGDIILMHDYIGHNSPTPEALRLILPELLAQGYTFVRISELIGINE